MAANKVFSIPELVEMILQELPFKEVLRSTRVNKTFQYTVKSFASLRRKLFLQQDSKETDELSIEMEKAGENWYFDRAYSDRASRAAQEDATKPALNPMLRYIIDSFSHKTDIRLEKVANPRSPRFDMLDWRQHRNSGNHLLFYKERVRYFTWIRIDDCRHGKLEAFLKGNKFKTKAWRAMYVTNRPCHIVVSIGSWKGEYRCPPHTKIEALLKDLVLVHRRRFPHRGSIRR